MKKEKTYYYEMRSDYLNILSIIFMIVLAGLTCLIMKLTNMKISLTDLEMDLILILMIPYLMFHEILHSIGYVVNGAKFKNITYGIHLEKGILCCSCKQTIKKKTIMWSLIYPFLIIGVITYIIGFIIGNKVLIVLSALNLAGCSGDLIMFLDFLKLKNIKFFEYDNPLAFGLISNEDLKNKKMLGLKLIEENNTSQTIGNKLTVSKESILLLILYAIICLINIML